MLEFLTFNHRLREEKRGVFQTAIHHLQRLSPLKKTAVYDDWIFRLLENPKIFPLSANEVKACCRQASKLLLSENALLRLPASQCLFVGDIHGQFDDLLHIFDRYGLPGKNNLTTIFGGDYVDRGPRSLEVICLLLALKLRYPDQVYLLRGNHETAMVSQAFGFRGECLRRLGEGIWEEFVKVFDIMPLAAHVAAPISSFFVHGGISPYIQSLEDINASLHRPLDVTPSSSSVAVDLMWADPCPEIDRWSNSARGLSFRFGLVAVREFLYANGLKRMFRGHTAEEAGFSVMGDEGEVITIHSAPNYKGMGGAGAVALVEPDGTYRIEVMYEQPKESTESNVYEDKENGPSA